MRNSKANYLVEQDCERRFGRPIAGVDEAGRGPWAGPVVAAAVILNPDRIPSGIADSKALTPAARDRLYDEIHTCAQVGVAMADADRIDRDNILAATLWAMSEAVSKLPIRPVYTLVDGNICPPLGGPVEAIIKGDAKVLSVAAASIIAKVTRDRLMVDYAAQWPGFGFERHKGYGTRMHAEAIARLGLTPLHRRSFKPIQSVVAGKPVIWPRERGEES